MRSARTSIWDPTGDTEHDAGAEGSGPSQGALRMSEGMPTYAGPRGGDIASEIDSATAVRASSAEVTVRAGRSSAANGAAWSPISWRIPRGPSGERRAVDTSLEMRRTGAPLTAASPKAARALIAPGPVVVSATPRRPVARA